MLCQETWTQKRSRVCYIIIGKLKTIEIETSISSNSSNRNLVKSKKNDNIRMDLLCYCNVSSNDERPGHISEISRTRACKHKNLVIHINTRTWGQVSRYECLYCSLDRLGRHRSFYAVSCTTRLSMLVVYVAEEILNPWISDTKIYSNWLLPIRMCLSSSICVSIWRGEPRTTWGKLGRKLVQKHILVFSAAA